MPGVLTPLCLILEREKSIILPGLSLQEKLLWNYYFFFCEALLYILDTPVYNYRNYFCLGCLFNIIFFVFTIFLYDSPLHKLFNSPVPNFRNGQKLTVLQGLSLQDEHSLYSPFLYTTRRMGETLLYENYGNFENLFESAANLKLFSNTETWR